MIKYSNLPPIIYKGSVKNVRGEPGDSTYLFEFSDRYSIFDWGEMPDLLQHKGKSLAWMSHFFFRFLGDSKNWICWKEPKHLIDSMLLQTLRCSAAGVPNHCVGLLPSIDDEKQANCLIVNAVQIFKPKSSVIDGVLDWNYDEYSTRPTNTLVPLEVIFRFGLPDGSSLLQRSQDDNYCASIGLQKTPKIGEIFDVPVIEFSTKLESTDRYLSYEQAQSVAGLSVSEFDLLIHLARLCAFRLRDLFLEIGIILWDGKLEFAFGNVDKQGERNFILVDSIGPDELRLTFNSVHLSKEILRKFYRKTPWYDKMQIAKKLAKDRATENWKNICITELNASPQSLPAPVKCQVEMIYMALARALSEKFDGAPIYDQACSLSELSAVIVDILNDNDSKKT